MNPLACPPMLEAAVCCRVAAHAAFRADAEEVARLRRDPCPAGMAALSSALHKHAEDQTALALTAVLRAAASRGWSGDGFAEWGVVAAPQFFGRHGIAQTIQRFAQEGAWGISPHLIPHQSLHAVSGTISQVLKIHGPNFGAGGGPESTSDALLLAAALLAEGVVPGVWLVLTGYEAEWVPVMNGQPAPRMPTALAVALALVADRSELSGLTLRIGPTEVEDEEALPPFHLADLVDALTDETESRAPRWRLAANGRAELIRAPGLEGSL